MPVTLDDRSRTPDNFLLLRLRYAVTSDMTDVRLVPVERRFYTPVQWFMSAGTRRVPRKG